ncbi:MAG: hypothetical protein HY904_08540 [Deltaproteobacteria bacterium]|nr:hypothetical protein [Deltaproteobacteria bacterium]
MQPLVELPRDDAPHYSEPVEWWYWHGHLRTPEQRWFAWYLSVFRLFEFGRARLLVHHAVVDVDAGRTWRATQSARRGVKMTQASFQMAVDPFTASACDGVDQLAAATAQTRLELTAQATRPPVLHHGNGRTDYEVGGYTFYCSRTHMQTQGTLQLQGEDLAVTGTTWFDHQWGRLGPQMAAGWDWFGIQLDDGRDVMLFFRHTLPGRAGVGATIMERDGTVRCLDGGPVTLRARGNWVSPHSGLTYAAGWDLCVDGLRLRVTPVCADQETLHEGMRYWEGAARVEGDATGRAFVELVGPSLTAVGSA